MFGKLFGSKETERDWSQGEITQPKLSVPVSRVVMPDPTQYVNNMIERANCISSASYLEVLTGVYRVVGAQLKAGGNALGIGNDVEKMFDQVILRDDFNFQLLIDALSNYGTSGVALGNKLTDLLDNQLAEALIPGIQQGDFDKKTLDSNFLRDWSQVDIIPKSPDVVKLSIPNYNDYVTYLNNMAGCNETASPNEVFGGVYRAIEYQLIAWAKPIDLEEHVSLMIKQIFYERNDADFQTLIDALSYLDLGGIILGENLSVFLEETLPAEIVPIIREGRFDLPVENL